MYSFDATIRKHMQHISSMNTRDREVFIEIFNAVLTDMTAVRTAIIGITAKLDADIGINDTDYAALHDPAALTLQS